MNQGVMLNAYPDSLGGNLAAEADFLARPECRGAFRSFYILPSLFNSDLDRGFSVASYDLNRLLADEGSLKRVGELGLDLKLDYPALDGNVKLYYTNDGTDPEDSSTKIEAAPGATVKIGANIGVGERVWVRVRGRR